MRGCSCRGTAGFAHVSCLAEQAKILFAEAEENNLDWNAKNERWMRWCLCSLCEQNYHGVVKCALGWACWKTYERPEGDQVHGMAMRMLGNGLSLQTTRGRIVRERGRTVFASAPWRIGKQPFSSCRAILRTRMKSLDGLKRPCVCDETFTLDG